MGRTLTRKDVIVLLLIALAGWGLHLLMVGRRPVGADLRGNATVAALLADRTAPSREVARATLTLVVFTDYQCPACKRAAPALEQAVWRDGHVRVSYRDWPIFGPRSIRAAQVAIAAAPQGVYPALHARLMAADRPLDDRALRDAVARSGGDWARVEQALERRGGEIDARIAETARAAIALGISGTPAFLVGPVLVKGALDEAGFRRAFARGREAQR